MAIEVSSIIFKYNNFVRSSNTMVPFIHLINSKHFHLLNALAKLIRSWWWLLALSNLVKSCINSIIMPEYSKFYSNSKNIEPKLNRIVRNDIKWIQKEQLNVNKHWRHHTSLTGIPEDVVMWVTVCVCCTICETLTCWGFMMYAVCCELYACVVWNACLY